MCPDRYRSRGVRERGVSLVTAIGIILLLSTVALYTMRTATTQQANSASDVLGVRAYQAARTGLEWAAYQVMKGDVSTGFCNGGATTASVDTLSGGLTGFSVAIACARTLHTEAGNTVRMYMVTATACNRAACPNASAEPNYVERQLTVVLSR